MASVAVFVPHHRGVHLLAPLFESLALMDRGSYAVRLILIDNATSDGSIQWLQTHHPDVHIETRPRNEGFALAINNAAHAASEDWLIFLNNDVRVERDWLVTLLDTAERLQSPCVSSHLLGWDGEGTQFAGGRVNAMGKGFESPDVLSDDPYEIFFPCGCGMAIRRDLFEQAGAFDGEYFMIYEDVDLGWRLRLMGHPVYFVPAARVYHKAHTSLSSESYATKAVYLERNSLATVYKNVGNETWAQLMPLVHEEALLRAQALGGWRVAVPYSSDGSATVDGVLAFMNAMPHWREKRAWVQQQRCVSDAELFAHWFPEPTESWAYATDHYPRIQHPEMQPSLNAIHEKIRSIFSTSR